MTGGVGTGKFRIVGTDVMSSCYGVHWERGGNENVRSRYNKHTRRCDEYKHTRTLRGERKEEGGKR